MKPRIASEGLSEKPATAVRFCSFAGCRRGALPGRERCFAHQRIVDTVGFPDYKVVAVNLADYICGLENAYASAMSALANVQSALDEAVRVNESRQRALTVLAARSKAREDSDR